MTTGVVGGIVSGLVSLVVNNLILGSPVVTKCALGQVVNCTSTTLNLKPINISNPTCGQTVSCVALDLQIGVNVISKPICTQFINCITNNPIIQSLTTSNPLCVQNVLFKNPYFSPNSSIFVDTSLCVQWVSCQSVNFSLNNCFISPVFLNQTYNLGARDVTLQSPVINSVSIKICANLTPAAYVDSTIDIRGGPFNQTVSLQAQDFTDLTLNLANYISIMEISNLSAVDFSTEKFDFDLPCCFEQYELQSNILDLSSITVDFPLVMQFVDLEAMNNDTLSLSMNSVVVEQIVKFHPNVFSIASPVTYSQGTATYNITNFVTEFSPIAMLYISTVRLKRRRGFRALAVVFAAAAIFPYSRVI